MTWEQVKAACERRKVALPADMASNAQAGTLREGLLERYLALHASGAFGRWCAGIGPLRDRLIADQRFLFKVRARGLSREMRAKLVAVLGVPAPRPQWRALARLP